MPVLLDVINNLCASSAPLCGKIKIVIPAANERAYQRIVEILDFGAARIPRPTVVVTRGGARIALRDADAAVVASGTATLEAALAGCPTVLVYKVGWLFAFLARRFIRGVKHIGLANIIAEKAGVPCPMPELLQECFTSDAVLACLRPWLTDESENAKVRQALADTVKLLKSDGAAVGRIVDFLNGKQEKW